MQHTRGSLIVCNRITRCVRWGIFCSAVGLWLTLFIHPKIATAHSNMPAGEQTLTLLAGHSSGPFTIDVTQYTKVDFTALEVRLGPDEPLLPADTKIEIEAISGETAQSFHAKLIRHHNTFITLLPSIDEDWQVSMTIQNSSGSGAVELNVAPYHDPSATSLSVRMATLGTPFLLLLVVLFVCRKFGIALMPKGEVV